MARPGSSPAGRTFEAGIYRLTVRRTRSFVARLRQTEAILVARHITRIARPVSFEVVNLDNRAVQGTYVVNSGFDEMVQVV